MTRRWTYFFGAGQTEGDPSRKDILGGKGASLAAMSRADLPVPPGFTIATTCCRLFLEGNGSWPDGLEEEVRAGLSRLESATGRRFGDPEQPLLVSVRSGAAVSMPGMMDTILNCGLSESMAGSAGPGFWPAYAGFLEMLAKTVAGASAEEVSAAKRDALGPEGPGGRLSADQARRIADAMKELFTSKAGRPLPADPWDALRLCIEAVWRSWNSPRAITYRRVNDVRGADGTAVNVQAMFPSQVSGILFTANPNDLSAGEMILESSYGLGESVVSGDVHPDRFVVDRGSLSVKHRTLGHKTHLVPALGDATRRDPDAPSLSDEQIRALAEVGLKVEAFFGRPVDIEWGWADGGFALLQARPIRGLDVAEDVEIGRLEEIHRLRELAGEKRRVWVIHNLAETLRSPTPLTWDVVRRFMSGNGGLGRMYRDFGYRPSEQVCREGFLELIAGRIYADAERAADLFWAGMPLSYSSEEVARNPRILERPPTQFDPDKASGRFFLQVPWLVWSMLRASRRLRRMRSSALATFNAKVLPQYLDWVRAKRSMDLTGLTTAQVLDELAERISLVIDDFAAESLKPGFFGAMALGALEDRLCQLMGRQAGVQEALALTQGLEGDTTVEQNVMLFRVARGEAPMHEFRDRFGHRAAGEMELANPRWEEDMTYVKQIMSAYLDESVESPEAMHAARAARRRQAEAALPETLARLGGSSFLEEIRRNLADAQTMLPYREAGKHYLMMGYQTIRLAVLELARRWNLGRDVFFLHLDELPLFEAQRDALLAKVAARKIRWQSARRLEMPDVIDSEDLESLGLPRQYSAADELQGEPIASGVASGKARVVFDPEQAAGACTDYVLVCPSTDPGWTALFVHARGLVVEQGGMLSHGAIVARDFGIPAVACRDATRRIPDGAMVRVDGNSGRVTILESPDRATASPIANR